MLDPDKRCGLSESREISPLLIKTMHELLSFSPDLFAESKIVLVEDNEVRILLREPRISE